MKQNFGKYSDIVKNLLFIENTVTRRSRKAQSYNNVYSSHLIVIVVGFVDTLVEVNETDGQATLNVSITQPLPVPGIPFQILFSLRVDSIDGSAGRDGIPQSCDFSRIIYLHYQILDGWTQV